MWAQGDVRQRAQGDVRQRAQLHITPHSSSMTHGEHSLATAYITRFISSWRSQMRHRTCAWPLPRVKSADLIYKSEPFTPALVCRWTQQPSCVQRRGENRRATRAVWWILNATSRRGGGNTKYWQKRNRKMSHSQWEMLVPPAAPKEVWLQ